jgi:hypothetical protein
LEPLKVEQEFLFRLWPRVNASWREPGILVYGSIL